MHDPEKPIEQLVHLYVDGAFSRRELIERVTRRTGTVAAALTVLAGFEELRASDPPTVPDGLRTTEQDENILTAEVSFPGLGGTVFGYHAWPANLQAPAPGLIVVHENRGLVEHIKDVTRRAAKAGFAALGVDLLSRQGGTQQFTDPASQLAAYNRTTQTDRRADLLAGLDFLKFRDYVVFDRIGILGFCAGGGNVWDFAVNFEEVAVAVPFYGAVPAIADVARIRAPVLAIYAERDRNFTTSLFPVAQEMVARQKTFGMFVYEGVGHAFHSDTSPNFNAEAASDAWRRAMAFCDKWLRAPRA